MKYFFVSLAFVLTFSFHSKGQTDCGTAATVVESQSKKICSSNSAPKLIAPTLLADELGGWSIVTGATINSNGQTSNLQMGINVFRYTIVPNKQGCESTFGDVMITVEKEPDAAFAGNDATTCDLDYQMSALPVVNGTGTWSASPIRGITFSPSVNDPHVVASGFFKNTTYVFTWNVSNGAGSVCLDKSDEVMITQVGDITSATPVFAQSRTICASDAAPLLNTNAVSTLTANETGNWSAVAPCTITPTGQTGNLQIGDNVFSYTITTNVPGCAPSVGTVTIKVLALPTANIIAPISVGNNATAQTTRKDAPVNIVANTPLTGYTGTWTIIKAPMATLSAMTSATTATINDLGAFDEQTTIVWKVKDNTEVCPMAEATLVITRKDFTFSNPKDTVICESAIASGFVVTGNAAQLDNLEGVKWTALDGGTIIYLAPDSSRIRVVNLPPPILNLATYRFEYSITNKVLGITSSQIATVKVYAMPSKPNSGLDDTTCTNTFQLKANNPVIGAGKWSAIPKSIVFDDVSKADAIASNLPNTQNSIYVPITLIWTVSNGICPSLEDTVIISKRVETTEPIARVDHSSVCAGATVKLIGNKPAADESGQWNMNTMAISPNNQETVEYTIPTNYSGELSFYYRINGKWCFTKSSDIVKVNVLNNPTIAQNILTNVKDCSSLPMVSGIIFADLNKNGTKENDEPAKTNTKITIQPSGFYTFTDKNGYYEFMVSNIGTYTLEVDESPCTSAFAKSIVFATLGEKQTQNIALDIAKPTKDLRISLTSYNTPRPGFDDVINVSIENRSNVATETVVTFTAPNKFNVTSSTGLGITLDNITWNLGTLKPYQFVSGSIYGKISSSTAIGDTLSFSSTVNPNDQDDINLMNNISKLKRIVRGSYDPNDKQGPSAISPSQVASSEVLDYTVRFQNTGNDTAFTVVIEDTLSANVNVSSLEFVSSSHHCKTTVLGNTTYFEFKNILLPDSNVNEKASHGFVRYTVKPKNTLVLGNTILNRAAIYFDYNSPVITNSVVTKVMEPVTAGIETTTEEQGTIAVFPNPAKELLNIKMDQVTNETSFELTDISGQLILKQILKNKNSQINISELKSGTYLYRISTSGTVKYGRVVRE
jgi:uncharacterized repeat protein (TIGR01451 family)